MDDVELQKLVAEEKRELREDESTRRQALEQFRDWIEKNPDIRDCRTDDVFLLSFLRRGKFSIQIAQEIFLRFATFCENFSHFSRRNGISDPKMAECFSNGFVYAGPYRTERGCSVLIVNCARFDPKSCIFDVYMSAIWTSFLMAMESEATQVLGMVLVSDFAGITPAHVAQCKINDMLALSKALQKTIPIRYKGVHLINLPTIMKWIIDLIISSLSHKMAARFMVHSSLDELYKHLDRKLLPKELGGDMPEADMVALRFKRLEEKRDLLVRNESLRLVQLQDLKTNIATLPGSFRKLDVD